ncbi:DUF1501 domain-containing protein [Blastopirellula marina]|uniref:DUF1501 domain-containing protein n=1 Tax=Blastopirellula marina TaxID=124 RepID=A0A2S8FN51_9BACT|nr:DUF1501 domain-containing protein [Blastopirellula marina]PQO33625.1 DUF1501 domain-containing protein [Blastopirellula marina]PTL43412.1 DUF1501 domain-containing protein [Blastopirellula marina]
MLSFMGRSTTLCDRLSRREWMRVGGLGAFALSSGALTSAQASQRAGSFGKAKRCIVLFMLGGPPQHETWDPKPDAPREIRGDFGTIGTATPGYHVGELMPLTAKLTERIAVLRAMATDDNAHSSSGYWMLTGRPHSPKGQENALPGAPNNWPSLPAVVRHVKGDQTSLPGAIRLPEEIWNTGHIVWPGQDSGWLGDHADPWLVTCDPNKPDFHVPDIGLPVEISPERFSQRNALRSFMNEHFRSPTQSTPVQRWSTWQHKAIELLGSHGAQAAFSMAQEPDAVRDRYGRNRFGQSVLLARRLVEQGVSLVQVNWTRWEDDESIAPAWDTHAKNAERLKKALMPPMDQAYSALLEDLEQRGLLHDTLVVWMGEFGRSPKINGQAGRDHWGHCFSVALAGGGVQGGAVHGQSDRQGGYPLDGRVEPQDLAATVYHCLGIGPETMIQDPFGRPLAITTGKPVHEIL